MLDVLKRFLSPEYLIVSEPGFPAGLWLPYAALGLLFASGVAVALRVLFGFPRGTERAAGGRRAWAWFEFWVCLVGLATVLGRFLGWPGWSARIWPYSLALLALSGALAYRCRDWSPPRWLDTQLRILVLDPGEPASHQTGARDALSFLTIGAGHVAFITMVVHTRYGLPAWSGPLVLLALLAPQWPLLARRRLPSLAALTPLMGIYGIVLLWWLYRTLGITIIGWQGLAFPNPLVSLFYVDGVALASLAYAMLCQLRITSLVLRRPAIRWRWPVLGLLVLTLAWVSVVYFTKTTHGATASDPYAYAQMGVDLVERGTFLHRFALFQDVIPLKIAWAPLQPVGYHIPRNSLGDCPSVWATGASVILAGGYKLLGEVGLYFATPTVALLALVATWALVQEVLRGESRPVRHLTAAVAVALLATSTEHVDRLLVPMADAPAQLFTVLTLLFALRSARLLEGSPRRALTSLALTGACFAWAYWVRHTQLVLAIAIIVAVGPLALTSKTHLRRSLLALTAVFGVALVTALPDILYRWRVFGGPFATETTELPSMALNHVAPMAWQTLRDALVAGEWGYLFPLVLYGGYRLATRKHRSLPVLGTAFAAILAVHLTYRFLRLRDLLSLFPLIAVAAAFGTVRIYCDVRSLWKRRIAARQLSVAPLSVGVLAWLLLSLGLSRWAMMDRLSKPGWASFGYMQPDQRAALDRLAELTPPDSVIGASLNAGAITLYTGRDAIRPYDSWTEAEWTTFLNAIQDLGRTVYLLDDGSLMAEFVEQQSHLHHLEPIEALQVPIFNARDRTSGWLYRLEGAQ